MSALKFLTFELGYRESKESWLYVERRVRAFRLAIKWAAKSSAHLVGLIMRR